MNKGFASPAMFQHSFDLTSSLKQEKQFQHHPDQYINQSLICISKCR